MSRQFGIRNFCKKVRSQFLRSKLPPIGGLAKSSLEDFKVREVSLHGEIAGKTQTFGRKEARVAIKNDFESGLKNWNDFVEGTQISDIEDLLKHENRTILRFEVPNGKKFDFLWYVRKTFKKRGIHIGYKHPDTELEENIGPTHTVLFLSWQRKYLKTFEEFGQHIALELQQFLVKPIPAVLKLTTSAPALLAEFVNRLHSEKLEAVVKNENLIHVRWKYRISLSELKQKPLYRFVLTKSGRESSTVLHSLEKRLRLPKGAIHIAGQKDTLGVTSQFCTIRGVSKEELERIRNETFQISNIEPFDQDLQRGDLKGNQFEAKIRDVQADTLVVNQRCEEIRDEGFVNFFGHQRFGLTKDIRNGSGDTYIGAAHIGLEFLKKNWKTALELYFIPTEREILANSPFTQIKLKFLETGDVSGCIQDLEKMHNGKASREWPILTTLDSKDYESAFNKLHYRDRTFYVEAFKSLCWNRAVADRLKRNPQIQIGDIIHPTFDYQHRFANYEKEKLSIDRRKETRFTLKELKEIDSEMDAENYSLQNLMFATPGIRCQGHPYFRKVYDPMLEKYGLTWDDFDLTPYGLYFSMGGLRRVIIKPKNLTWLFNSPDLSLKFELPCSTYATALMDQMTAPLEVFERQYFGELV